MNKLCLICGNPLPKGRLKYCSEACMEAAEKHRPKRNTGKPSGNPTMHWTTHCIDCGIEINRPIKCIRCENCQREIDRIRKNIQNKHGAVRPLGSIDVCKRCGKEYVVEGGLQKYCKGCAKQAIRESVNASKRAHAARNRADPEKNAKIKRGKQSIGIKSTCPICGKEFMAKSNAMYCSDECRKEGKRRYLKTYDAARHAKAKEKREQINKEKTT